MGRVQVYLSDEELALLDGAARTSGASRSALIRRAVRSTFGEASKDDRLRAVRESAGSWRGRRQSGAQYVDSRRGDLGARLRRLGIE